MDEGIEEQVALYITGVGVLIGALIVGILITAGVALSWFEGMVIATVSGLILVFLFFYSVG